MGLISKTVKIKWNSVVRKWYELKGYIFTKWKDEFEVTVEDLTNGSSTLVNVKCDCPDCKNPYLKPMEWRNYLTYVKKDGKYYCNKCANKLFGTENMKQIKLKYSISFQQWCIENDRQDVLNRWDYKLNNCLPNEIAYGTTKKYYFKCQNDIHESELKCINHFTNGQEGSINCNKCNSFEQWCIDNDKHIYLKLWDNELNDKLPSEINYGTNEKFYFICPRGIHKSELKRISTLTSKKQNNLRCNKCNSFAQHLIDKYGEKGINDYWDYEKNSELGINPWEISYSSTSSVWIKCQNKDKPYHESYVIKCSGFIFNERCPYCNSKQIHFMDSLGYMLPYTLQLWSNLNDKTPFEYSPQSHHEAWWKCPEGKHDDYFRDVKHSYCTNFRCPECVRERDESFLQEKVRLYIENLGYTINHENKCTIIPRNPRTKKNNTLPFDNEIKELKLIIEVHGLQHYEICGFHKMQSKHNDTTPEYELHYQQLKDRYKRIFAKSQGYFYLEIPYNADNKKETWKKLIDNKIKEIKNKVKL